MTCNVTVGTFNILDPVFAQRHHQRQGLDNQGQSNWSTRGPRLITCIKNSNLDVICLQEVSEVTQNYFKQGTQDTYDLIWLKHGSRHDGVAILYKKGKFERKDFRGIPTGSGLHAAYVDLQDKTSQAVFRVASCHLLGGPQKGAVHPGKTQIDEYVSHVEKQDHYQVYKIDAKVIVGDFNEAFEDSEKFQSLKSAHYATDGSMLITEPDKNRKIDWIWVKSRGFLEQLPISQDNDLSDHRLLATKLILPLQNPDAPPPKQLQPIQGLNIKRPQTSKIPKQARPSAWKRFQAFFLNIFKAIADLFSRKR